MDYRKYFVVKSTIGWLGNMSDELDPFKSRPCLQSLDIVIVGKYICFFTELTVDLISRPQVCGAIQVNDSHSSALCAIGIYGELSTAFVRSYWWSSSLALEVII